MTKEKAINELNDLKDYCKHTFGIRTLLPYLKSLDMAIEALKQESCEDAPDIRIGECEDVISRDDAIKAAETMLDACSRDITEQINTLNNVDWMKMKIRELPPVQPKSGWIPVSERLPEEEFNRRTVYRYPCLVTRKASHDLVSPERTYVAEQYFNGKIFVNTMGCDCHKDVIAWMPLPEPMKVDKSN